MVAIRREVQAVVDGNADPQDNVLKHAPHTAAVAAGDVWTHPYSRAEAVFPLESLRGQKFWPPIGRINSTYGDRHLVCTCPPLETYAESEQS